MGYHQGWPDLLLPTLTVLGSLLRDPVVMLVRILQIYLFLSTHVPISAEKERLTMQINGSTSSRWHWYRIRSSNWKYIYNYSSFNCQKKLSCCFWSISYTWTMVVLLECFQWSCTPTNLHLLEFNHTYKLCTWSSRYRALDTIPPHSWCHLSSQTPTRPNPQEAGDPQSSKIHHWLARRKSFWNLYGSVPSNFDSICRYLKIIWKAIPQYQSLKNTDSMLLLDAVKPNLSPAKHHMVYQQVVEAPSKIRWPKKACGCWLPGAYPETAYPMFGWTKYEIERKVSVPTNAVEKLLYHFNVYVSVNIYIIYNIL